MKQHVSSIDAFLRKKGVEQNKVTEIMKRAAAEADARGWILEESLDDIFPDLSGRQEYEGAVATDPSLRMRDRTISIVMNDVPQVLARVIGLLSARGFNIDELNVCPSVSTAFGVGEHKRVSRGTISLVCSDVDVGQVVAQLSKQVDVRLALDLTDDSKHARARISLVKVTFADEETMTLALSNATDGFRAKSVRTGKLCIIFRFTGSLDATLTFYERMAVFGHVETASTGVLALR